MLLVYIAGTGIIENKRSDPGRNPALDPPQ